MTPAWLVSLLPAFRLFACIFPIPRPRRDAPIHRDNGVTFKVSAMNRVPPRQNKVLAIIILWTCTIFAKTIERHRETSSEINSTVIKLLASFFLQFLAFTVNIIPKLMKFTPILKQTKTKRHKRNETRNKLPLVSLYNSRFCEGATVSSPSVSGM